MAAVVRALPALADGPGLRLRRAADAGGGSRPVLLYLFQRADCARHRRLQRLWADLDRTGLAAVRGVPLGAWTGGSTALPIPDPGFRVRPDLREVAERLVKRLGYRTTPLTVLLDGRGRARLVLPPPADDRDAEAEVRAVRAALEVP